MVQGTGRCCHIWVRNNMLLLIHPQWQSLQQIEVSCWISAYIVAQVGNCCLKGKYLQLVSDWYHSPAQTTSCPVLARVLQELGATTLEEVAEFLGARETLSSSHLFLQILEILYDYISLNKHQLNRYFTGIHYAAKMSKISYIFPSVLTGIHIAVRTKITLSSRSSIPRDS